MARLTAETKVKIESLLNERFDIMDSFNTEESKSKLSHYHVEQAYYHGLCQMVVAMGYNWERDTKGKHMVY